MHTMPPLCHRAFGNSNDNNSAAAGPAVAISAVKKVVLLLFTASLLLVADAASSNRHQLSRRNHDHHHHDVNHYRAPRQHQYQQQDLSKSVFIPPSETWGITKKTTIVTTISRGGAASLKKLQNTKKEGKHTVAKKEGKHTVAKVYKIQNNRSTAADDDQAKLLILIRIMFFAYYASLGSLLPYLPVYYHSLGHGGQIIGMLGAIKPFTTFLVAPLWGIISDQTGSPFTVLYFTFLVSLVGQLAVSWRHDPFWIMSMVFITALFNAPVKSLLDSMVMSNIKNGKLYGRLRLWGQLGFGVGSSVVGIILSRSQQAQQQKEALGVAALTTAAIMSGTGTTMEKMDQIWQKITGYKLLFFTHALLSVPTFLCIRAFHRRTKKKDDDDSPTTGATISISTQKGKNKNIKQQLQHAIGKIGRRNNKSSSSTPNVLEGIRVLFHNSDAMLFFFLVLVVGISSGVIENFAYVRIREVGGSGREMGLSRLVSSLAGAPMFWFSGPLTELLGADRVLALSLINYVFRYFNYAFMKSPLQGLPAEALRGATFAAFWSTCTIYASRIAPPGMQATMVSEMILL